MLIQFVVRTKHNGVSRKLENIAINKHKITFNIRQYNQFTNCFALFEFLLTTYFQKLFKLINLLMFLFHWTLLYKVYTNTVEFYFQFLVKLKKKIKLYEQCTSHFFLLFFLFFFQFKLFGLVSPFSLHLLSFFSN